MTNIPTLWTCYVASLQITKTGMSIRSEAITDRQTDKIIICEIWDALDKNIFPAKRFRQTVGRTYRQTVILNKRIDSLQKKVYGNHLPGSLVVCLFMQRSWVVWYSYTQRKHKYCKWWNIYIFPLDFIFKEHRVPGISWNKIIYKA